MAKLQRKREEGTAELIFQVLGDSYLNGHRHSERILRQANSEKYIIPIRMVTNDKEIKACFLLLGFFLHFLNTYRRYLISILHM